MVAVVAVACGSTTASEPRNTTTAETAAAEPEVVAGVQPEGFTTATLRVTKPDGDTCDVCVWLATTSEERGRGLMDVTDLGAPAGMAFSYSSVSSNNFVMFQTPMPLSIAWFAANGTFVSATDMEPCLDQPSASCARYSPDAEYTLAVEVPQGDLALHGLVPGSLAELVADGAACSVAISD